MKPLSILLAALTTLLAAGECASQPRTAGHDLWLGYAAPRDSALREQYAALLGRIELPEGRYDAVIREELRRAARGLAGVTPRFGGGNPTLRFLKDGDPALGEEGFVLASGGGVLTVRAAADAGTLYGAFDLLRRMQSGEPLDGLHVREVPAYDRRMLNHWDDLDGNVERGYAGESLWKWDELPARIDPRCEDYARANASVGINSVVLNNVNADPRILRRDYIEKVAALAGLFRRYHIRVYLTANFAAPLKPSATPDAMKAWGGAGDLDTADPRDPRVADWWRAKADEIYALIPDFGGFLVKADSEGMPGPQDYGCTHAEGANLLARALRPHGGIVLWRTFVYNPGSDPDRMKRSYLEFAPLDGRFDDNVILQTKYGPLDFQPSEPVQPLFGAMRRTQTMLELQITQEYTGHATYLVYLLPLWRSVLGFDTRSDGPGSTVARITRGAIRPQPIRAIAGVANTGNAPDWTGHPFAQANWYAFGRLAWNPDAAEERITCDWIRATWHTDRDATRVIREMMLPTWETFVRSSSPYGLGLTVDVATHYRAAFETRAGREWQADADGIGTDRTSRGSNFVGQYAEPVRAQLDDPARCPERWLLSFHRLPWDHRMRSGRTLREEFFEGLEAGPRLARENLARWESLRTEIDPERNDAVLARLRQELRDATLFRDRAVAFFTQAAARRPAP